MVPTLVHLSSREVGSLSTLSLRLRRPISRYIANVLRLVREHRRYFLGIALAGLVLRLFFFVYFPAITDDSRGYADFATNWLQHGVYGQTRSSALETKVVPADTRLPGYPAFLVLMFWLFGVGNFKAVMLAQILIDLCTCLIVADLARRALSDRTFSGRAARIAFALAALCPFLANYACAALTETLEIFFTALALDCAAVALGRTGDGPILGAAVPVSGHKTGANLGHPRHAQLWAATGLAIGACILLRPDGGILLAAVGCYLAIVMGKRCAGGKNSADVLVAGIIVMVFALGPLVPWTIRNFRTLHHFQPLAPRYAGSNDDVVPRGFNRWAETWIIDYASVEEIYWSVPGEMIDAEKLPSRAFDNAAERDATLAVIADYNASQDLTPELDARFGGVAAGRIRAHPVRYFVVLPVLRIADMWLRPRTEILPPDVRWWEFNDDVKASVMAVGFGLLNLAYVMAALLALVGGRLRGAFRGTSCGTSRSDSDCTDSEIRWVELFVLFVLLRSAFLGTLENPEPRYTLECYPVVILCAAVYLAKVTKPQES